MDKLLVILGPTATGKTDLALKLAKKFNGELVSCDSRQVYRSLDIGTGKMPSKKSKLIKQDGQWIINGINVWMYDVVNPKRQYNVARFAKDAERIVADIYKRKKLPILVGGTGLYIKAIVEGLSNLSLPVNLDLRKKLEKLSKADLQIKLQKISPEKWDKMNYSDRQNPRRLIRAIELAGTQSTKVIGQNYDTLKIGLTAPREILYLRIDESVLSRINQGMLEETKKLQSNGLSVRRMKQLGLEYGVMADYLSGNVNKDQLIKIMQEKIHGFARRQLTWFKKAKDVFWFDITEREYTHKIEKLIGKWYD